MREIIEILMRRDGLSEYEASNLAYQCKDHIFRAIENFADYDEIVDILMYDLGLEPDYLDVLLPE